MGNSRIDPGLAAEEPQSGASKHELGRAAPVAGEISGDTGLLAWYRRGVEEYLLIIYIIDC